MMEKDGWKVIRAGGSLGEADLVCVKKGNCVFLQIKSTKKKTFYYYGYKDKEFQGFPFYLVVDFGYGKMRILFPTRRVDFISGEDFKDFLKKFN